MDIRKIIVIITVVSAVCIAVVLLQLPRQNAKDYMSLKAKHYSRQDDPEFYNQAYAIGTLYRKRVPGHVMGGIIPHHLLAGPLIAGFFSGLDDYNIRTVILIGPNHYASGPYGITSSEGVWKTVFGTLETDSAKVNRLVSSGTVSVYEPLFDREHAVYGIAPFIKRTFPHALFVPIVLKSTVTRTECNALARALTAVVDDHTLVLASVDFSHYLSSNEADTFDMQSIAALTAFDTNKVFQLHPTHNADSPGALYTLLRVMQAEQVIHATLLVNSNSAKLTRQPDLTSTTSYVTMYFSR